MDWIKRYLLFHQKIALS
ncbi:MAG: hypothetical protein ACKPJA_15820, partial [Microcystis panniformis]